MRIVDYIQHPRMKITIFQYEGKYSVKMEASTLEFNLKFREGDVDDLDELKKLVEQDIVAKIDESFKAVSTSLLHHAQDKMEDEEFEPII